MNDTKSISLSTLLKMNDDISCSLKSLQSLSEKAIDSIGRNYDFFDAWSKVSSKLSEVSGTLGYYIEDISSDIEISLKKDIA